MWWFLDISHLKLDFFGFGVKFVLRCDPTLLQFGMAGYICHNYEQNASSVLSTVFFFCNFKMTNLLVTSCLFLHLDSSRRSNIIGCKFASLSTASFVRSSLCDLPNRNVMCLLVITTTWDRNMNLLFTINGFAPTFPASSNKFDNVDVSINYNTALYLASHSS